MSPSLKTLHRFYLSENRLSPAFLKQSTVFWADEIQFKKPLKQPISISTRTARLGLSVVLVFSQSFFIKFNARACLNFPTVVATWLYSFQTRDLVSPPQNSIRFPPVPSPSKPRVILSMCSSTKSARCSVRFRLGQLVPASNTFLHTTLLREHYAIHFPESLLWSYLQFSPPASAKHRQHFFLLAFAWIFHWQLLTLNQRLVTVVPSRLLAPLAIPPTSAPGRTPSTSTSLTITPAPSR